MRHAILGLTVLWLMSPGAFGQSSETDRRHAELDHLLKRLPESKPFHEYLKKSGDLPPDFDALPSHFPLHDPLAWTKDGKEARVTQAEWPERRKQLAALTETWLLGAAPPPPGNVEAEILEKTQSRGYEMWKVKLRFGPNQSARLGVQLYVPKDQGKPSPIFVCDSERYLPWAEGAMAKGFGFAVHNARDGRDESRAYADLFGDYTWSALRRRGWSAGRVLDWLVTLPFVDPQRIYVGGHSRSGKTSMIAAAFDTRFAGVIASSAGTGGSMPYRYSDPSTFGESAEYLTRTFPDWVLPRVRFFSGREQKLPADCHFLFAMIAPRPVLMSVAIHDWVDGTWAIEQVYSNIHPVYELLGAGQNLGLRYRPGQHATDAATHRDYSSWLEAVAGIGAPKTTADMVPFKPYHVWDYAAWEEQFGKQIDPARFPALGTADPTRVDGQPVSADRWPARREEILKQLAWLLGDGPAYEAMPAEVGRGLPGRLSQLLARDRLVSPRKGRMRFGGGINADILYPDAKPGAPRPCVIWLGPFHTSSGYFALYNRVGPIPPNQIVGEGFVTTGFDHIGIGSRQEERAGFFRDHPDWSLMGKMALDARHAVDAAAALPEVDPKRIYLVGYAMGGTVALLTAAMDDRVAGVVSIAGVNPWRTDAAGKGTGGLERYAQLHGWIPRLGRFVGREARVPVDFPEILAAIAPRPALILAPRLDRYATAADVEAAVESARKAYALLGRPQDLRLEQPDDENRLTEPMEQAATTWLKSLPAR